MGRKKCSSFLAFWLGVTSSGLAFGIQVAPHGSTSDLPMTVGDKVQITGPGRVTSVGTIPVLSVQATETLASTGQIIAGQVLLWNQQNLMMPGPGGTLYTDVSSVERLSAKTAAGGANAYAIIGTIPAFNSCGPIILGLVDPYNNSATDTVVRTPVFSSSGASCGFFSTRTCAFPYAPGVPIGTSAVGAFIKCTTHGTASITDASVSPNSDPISLLDSFNFSI